MTTTTAKASHVWPPDSYTGPAIWRNSTGDMPTTVIGFYGVDPAGGGERYFMIEGSGTGVPASQLLPMPNVLLPLSEAAERYAALGWALLPLRPQAKEPATAHGKDDATADPDRVASWWTTTPNANIGLACGASGLVALDFDTGKPDYAGAELLTYLMDNFPTTTAKTGSGGFHLLYLQPDGTPLGDGRGKMPKHVDVKGAGYIVLAPSVHPNGNRYEWLPGRDPEQLPPAPLPAEVLDLIRPHDKPTTTAKASPAPLPVGGMGDVAKAAEALKRLAPRRCEDYEEWLHVGMALSELGGVGLTLWDEWSKGSSKYKAGECGKVWTHFKPGAGRTLASLIHWANEDDPAGRPQRKAGRPKTPPSSIPADAPAPDAPAPSAQAETAPAPEAQDSWNLRRGQYGISGGQLGRWAESVDPTTGEIAERFIPLADFAATIVGEFIDEDGARRFVIEGRGRRGGPWQAEIAGGDYGDTGKLTGLLEAQSSLDTIHVGARPHIGPAIKTLSQDVWRQQRYTRVGWRGDKFLIPGREPDNVRIELPEKLPYSIPATVELDRGLAALDALLQAPGAERGAIIAAYVLGAPLARRAEWGNERYGLAIVGRTGTFKTTTAQLFLSLFGPGFLGDHSLIGPANLTRNAAIALAASAHDLPLLLDNYKPNMSGGAADLVALVHSIVEGGDKLRLNRASELKAARPIHTWPLFTGEDLPNTDAAALARMLVLRFERTDDGGNPLLTLAQRDAHHLAAVGGAWIDWLESDEGRHHAKMAGQAFPERRGVWAERLRSLAPGAANPLRVASNLAINAIAYDVAQRHPTIGPILRRYAQAHGEGLAGVGRETGTYTTHSSEGARFLAGLTELLVGGRAVLRTTDPATADTFPGASLSVSEDDWARRGVGHVDGAGVYLVPKLAISLFKRELRDDLGGITEQALYAQLDAAGAIRPGKDEKTYNRKINGRSTRVLHILPSALGGGVNNDGD